MGVQRLRWTKREAIELALPTVSGSRGAKEDSWRIVGREPRSTLQ
jgi:hypothetical protein